MVLVTRGLTIRGSRYTLPEATLPLEEVMIVTPSSIDACIRMPDHGIDFRGRRIKNTGFPNLVAFTPARVFIKQDLCECSISVRNGGQLFAISEKGNLSQISGV